MRRSGMLKVQGFRALGGRSARVKFADTIALRTWSILNSFMQEQSGLSSLYTPKLCNMEQVDKRLQVLKGSRS